MDWLLNPGITIFGFTIYYYAIVIVIGMLAASVLSALLMKRRNMAPDFVFTLFIFCIPSAIICARLFYCITDSLPLSEWLSFRDGGLSILGGVIGGVLAGLIVCLVKKINFFRAADCVVINILLAQAIGRWGNFFNGEVYGAEITDPSMQWFPLGVLVNGKWYQALFFYESVVNLVGFALLFTAAWFFVKKPNGLFTFAYFAWYGTVRSIMEPMRNPAYILGDDVMWSRLTAILMIVFGLAGILTLLVLNYRKEGAFIGSKKGDPCGITDYIPCYKDDKPYFSKINIFGSQYPPKPPKEGKGVSDEAGSQDQTGAPAPADGETGAPETQSAQAPVSEVKEQTAVSDGGVSGGMASDEGMTEAEQTEAPVSKADAEQGAPDGGAAADRPAGDRKGKGKKS